MRDPHHRPIEDRIAEQDDARPHDRFPWSAMGDDLPADMTPRAAMHKRREANVLAAEAKDIRRRQRRTR